MTAPSAADAAQAAVVLEAFLDDPGATRWPTRLTTSMRTILDRLRQVEEERDAAERLVRGYQARTILRDGEGRDAEVEPEPCDGDCDCDCQPGQSCLCPERDCYCGPCRVCGETPQQRKEDGRG